VPSSLLSRVETARRGAFVISNDGLVTRMTEPEGLITFIVGGIVAAFGLGLLAHRMRISPIVGYLLAGILIGPHTPGFVAHGGIARQIADIGVILIMFGLGLKFSLSALLAFRWRPLAGATVQMLVVTGLGAALGRQLGLGMIESLIFGFSLSVASTVVLLRALEEGAMLTRKTGGMAVCWVLVQDVAAILALVTMPTLAQASSGEVPPVAVLYTLAMTAGQVALFIALMLILGRRLLPPLLSFLIEARLRELFSLGVFAIALGVAFLAHKVFGVSFALGAFFAGLVLNEADIGHRATEDMSPLRDAFGVLFFVSMGMLFDPSVVLTHGWAICAVLAVIILGNGLASFVVGSALGLPLRQRLILAAGIAQVGEFSFLLSGFCLGLGLITLETQTLILAGALIAIAVNPVLFHLSEMLAQRAASTGVAARPVPAPGPRQ
jgi:monovalent cation:H+ antiporter-2, CPA2 family